jgi:hypothetical protein
VLKVESPEYRDRQLKNCKSWSDEHREHLSEYHKGRRIANIEEIKIKSRAYSLKKYGMNEESYTKFVAAHNNSCKICGAQPKPGKKLHIDHCHTTKKVRGLLCIKCNCGLGSFNDSEELLMKAIGYLNDTK